MQKITEEVKEDFQINGTKKYYVGLNMDCLDELNQWLNVEIISVNLLVPAFVDKNLQIRQNRIKVHYTGFSVKYDEWIEEY